MEISTMQKLIQILFLSSFLVNTLLVLQGETLPDSYLGRRRVTKLRFYLQDVVGGDNRTVWTVAKADVVASNFGTVFVLDNKITCDPEFESTEMGRMQGLVALSDLRVTSLSMLLNVVFTHGEYKGSTLSIVGRNPLMDPVREVSIVGGTGAFRMASGYVITTTYSLDDAGIRNVLEYNLFVYHWDDNAGIML